MPKRLPPAQTLQAFDAAARHMSFTEAARELGITQAAISQRIRLLEHHLGQPLFVRHARGIELTDAGRSFVPAVSEAFQRLATGVQEAFGPARDASVTLRTTPGFAALWLAPRLRDFHERHPEIRIRITTAVWPSDFPGQGADLEVRYGDGHWDDVDSVALTRERVTPVCTPGLAVTLNAPGDLAHHTLLHAVGFQTGWPHWLAAAGVSHLLESTPSILCDTMVVVHELALNGLGVAIGRSDFIEPALAEGRLVAPFDRWLDTDEAFYLTRPFGESATPHAQRFWEWMLSAAPAADG
jgi:LysR family glycine cleavage system transcriptional activator